MAIKYGFFDSIDGDRKYCADDISNFFIKLISNGVFANPSNAMQVTANNGMTVQVSAGWGFINAKYIQNTSSYPITLDTADATLNRIDRIVIGLNSSYRSISIYVKKGTPASNPTAPTLARITGGYTNYELSLAQIKVSAGATRIRQSDITDERGDTSLCGYVTGLIDQIDTTNLFAQYDDAFNTWFGSIKNEVHSTASVRQYNVNYTTTAENEKRIAINIPEYNETLDILYVYVNGLKLIKGVDYTINGNYITLVKPLSVIGTRIEFEVLKSV